MVNFQPRRCCVERDYISTMPPNVKEEVLMKLPIKEAVKTSILSTKWKYAWMSIPNLVFTEDCAQSELIRQVDQVLLMHDGPILQFKLISRHPCDEAIGRWLLILSRNGIKNFHIKLGDSIRNFTFPFSFFSCLALEHVHIYFGKLHLPPSFSSFKFLLTLRLLKLYSTGIFLAKLIASCPLLEILELADIYIFEDHFIIRALNLRWLSITGCFMNLCLETPKMLFAKIYREIFDGFDHWSVKEVLGNLSAIEELQLNCSFLSCFDDDEECKPEVPFYQLTEFHIDFDYISEKEFGTAFCLFKSAPNLKVLSLKLPNYDGEEMEDDDCEDNMFGCLKIVKITYSVEDPQPILQFAKFFLHAAPVLEKLVLREMKVRRETRSFLKKLASFPRLSKIAQIVFVK